MTSRKLSNLFLFLMIVAPQIARAHDPSLSGIRITFRPNDVVVTVSTHISRLMRAEGAAAGLRPVQIDMAIRKRLLVEIDGNRFVPVSANVIGDTSNDQLSWQSTLPRPGTRCSVLARLYPEDPNSRTDVTVMREGVIQKEALLDAANPSMGKSVPEPRWRVAIQYIKQGILHILSGPDHIAFVLGLLLLGGGLKPLLKTVTAFTIAHSITLSLAATGVFNPSSRVVEPLIALSIVAIAVDNLRPRTDAPLDGQQPTRDWRPYYAFGFGLVHGFGFAGALTEAGLPTHALGTALASFNVGVEIGQASIVLLVAPAVGILKQRKPAAHLRLAQAASVVIGLAGSCWFFTRLRG